MIDGIAVAMAEAPDSQQHENTTADSKKNYRLVERTRIPFLFYL